MLGSGMTTRLRSKQVLHFLQRTKNSSRHIRNSTDAMKAYSTPKKYPLQRTASLYVTGAHLSKRCPLGIKPKGAVTSTSLVGPV